MLVDLWDQSSLAGLMVNYLSHRAWQCGAVDEVNHLYDTQLN